MSTYGIPDLEGAPRRGATYIVCKDGSIQDRWQPERPIGWELIEDESSFYYRVTQMNHEPEPLAVFFMGQADDIPVGGRRIGSVVFAARPCGGASVTGRVAPEPAKAEITEQKDDGEEVTSNLLRIAAHNPDMAMCAALLNDPVQTAAMANFMEGKMSYAEMRGLCG
jgi:hypothetical protein